MDRNGEMESKCESLRKSNQSFPERVTQNIRLSLLNISLELKISRRMPQRSFLFYQHRQQPRKKLTSDFVEHGTFGLGPFEGYEEQKTPRGNTSQNLSSFCSKKWMDCDD